MRDLHFVLPDTEMTPERLAAEYLEQAPGAAQVLDTPLLGPLLRGRLSKDLKAAILAGNACRLYGIDPLMVVEERIDKYKPAILPW